MPFSFEISISMNLLAMRWWCWFALHTEMIIMQEWFSHKFRDSNNNKQNRHENYCVNWKRMKMCADFHPNDGKYHWKLNSCIYKWTLNSLASSAKALLSIIFISVGSLNIRFCILFKNKSKKCKISMAIIPLYTASHLRVWENIKIDKIEWKKREKRTKNKLHLKHQTCAHVQQICSSIQHFRIVECLKPLTRVAIYTQIHLRLDGIKFVASPISIKLNWNNKYAMCTRILFLFFESNMKWLLRAIYDLFCQKHISHFGFTAHQPNKSNFHSNDNITILLCHFQWNCNIHHIYFTFSNCSVIQQVCVGVCVALIICIFNLIAINWSRQFEIGYINIKYIKQHSFSIFILIFFTWIYRSIFAIPMKYHKEFDFCFIIEMFLNSKSLVDNYDILEFVTCFDDWTIKYAFRMNLKDKS